jgi:hypothetical protein
MDKQKFIISSYPNLVGAFQYAKQFGFEHPYCVEVRPLTRTVEQNAKLWALLGEIADQVNWHGQKLSSEDWKHVFSAALNQQRVVPNIDSTGFVVLGKSTSKMSVAEMMDMIELIHAFGAQHSVEFKKV